MTFDPKAEFARHHKELLEMVRDDEYSARMRKWVEERRAAGLTKKEIYDTVLELFVDVQTRPDPGEKLHDRLTDFLDGFTVMGKDFRILPEEPDVS